MIRTQHFARLSVAIDARIPTGHVGGVEQLLIGMAHGLSQLADGDEQYCFLTIEGQDDWIRPFLKGPCVAVRVPPRPSHASRLVGRWEPQARTALGWLGELAVAIPRSDGSAERAGCTLIHQTLEGFLTSLPTLFQLNDLQHVHYPQFFSRRDRAIRDKHYRVFANQAKGVVTLGRHGRRDIINKLKIPADKVFSIPLGSALQTYRSITNPCGLSEYPDVVLPSRYLLFPAQTWPHKNHLRLIDALAILKTENALRIPIVLTGRQTAHFPRILAHAAQLGVADQITAVGFIAPETLDRFYRMSHGVVFPSLFEGWGMPVSEAFDAGVPVACSATTSLPEVAGNAALLFNPLDPRDIASAIRALWIDDALRRSLIAEGVSRAASLTWDRTARILRAIYRKTANRAIPAEDELLLGESCPNHDS